MWGQSFLALLVAILVEQSTADGVSRKLPKITAKGMMRWKKWWWNDRDGLRQCDDSYGCNDIDDASEKVEEIKKQWKFDGDDELHSYMRRVRDHARTFSWSEQGHVYSFCKKYQGDLQEVLDYLDLKRDRVARAAARQQAKRTVEGRAGVTPKAFQETPDKKHEKKSEDKSGEPTSFEQARDTIESVEKWEQAKQASVEASSWMVLAFSTIWSYATAWLKFGHVDKTADAQQEL